jgi:hypothetical protein
VQISKQGSFLRRGDVTRRPVFSIPGTYLGHTAFCDVRFP